MDKHATSYSVSHVSEAGMAATAHLLEDLLTLHQSQLALLNQLVEQIQTDPLLFIGHNAPEHSPFPIKAPFYANLFGPFALYRGHSRIMLGHNKSLLELCRYLVAYAGQPIPRDVLIDLLWPHDPVPQATHRLHVAISTLRSALSDKEDRKNIILYEDDHYVLPNYLIVSDCLLFELYYQRAKQWLHQQDFENAAVAYRSAVAFCNGYYLADQPYAEWTQAPRTYFGECRINALTFLCEYAAMENNFAAMVDYAAQLLVLDNFQERAHRYLMRAYYSLGQRASAVAQYHRCLALLNRELSVAPSRQTQDLYEAICQDAPLPDEIPFFKNGNT
jgi:DNA-binding SARP family transcriptional activator